MKVTDLTLFAPDVTSISIACLILKQYCVKLTFNRL